MNIVKFGVDGKEVTLYAAEEKDCPLVVLNNFAGDGSSVLEAVKDQDEREFNLLCVGNLEWDHDMTPWYCPPLMPNDTPCTGGADEYLELLVKDILPKALEIISGTPSRICIAGYSLAGLFALYAMYHTDVFDRAASMSGSLWFPDFRDYVLEHSMKRHPDKLYISLGDKEARTRNKLLKTVRNNTEDIVRYYKEQGIDVTWELNPGNHFRDAAVRSAKGIMDIL